MRTTAASLLLLFAVLFSTIHLTFDNGQCLRACRFKFAKELPTYPLLGPEPFTGVWTLKDRLNGNQNCLCAKDGVDIGDAPRLYPRLLEPGYPWIWKDARVCGKDGVVYADANSAVENGTKTLHCGPFCGACSTEHDVQRYKEIGKDVTKVVGPCLLLYFLFGNAADALCMQNRAQYTPACSKCWQEDHGCLVAHCYHDCVFKGVTHYKRMLGLQGSAETKTSDRESCVFCMEEFCSESFISSCGVNRRNAGVETDLARNSREICAVT